MNIFLLLSPPGVAAEESFTDASFGGSLRGGLTEHGQFFTRDYQERQRIVEFDREVAEKIKVKESEELEGSRKLRWYKSLATGSVYSTNIFSTRNDSVDDFIFLYAPKIGIRLGEKGKSRAYLDTYYVYTYADYVENQKLSHFNQGWSTQMGYDFGRLSIDIGNNFSPNSTFDTGERTDLASAGSKQVVAYADNASVKALYKMTPKTSLLHSYGYRVFYFPTASNTSNENAPGNSYQEHFFNPEISYQMTPKTSVHAGYSFSFSDYFQGGDKSAKTQRVTFGITHGFSEKTFSNVQVGYKVIDYNQPSFPELKGYLYSASLSHRLTNKLSAGIFFGHNTDQNFDQSNSLESVSVGTMTSDAYTFSLTWTPAPTWSAAIFTSASYSERSGLFSEVDTENPTLTFTRPYEDQVYRAGVGLQWKPRTRFRYYLSYEFFNKNGSFKSMEYDSQRVSGSANLAF